MNMGAPEALHPERGLTLLYDINELLAQGEDLAALGTRLVALIGRGLGWDISALWLLDEQTGELTCHARWQRQLHKAMARALGQAQPPVPLNRTLVERGLAADTPVWLDRLSPAPIQPGTATPLVDMRTVVVVPIRDTHQTVGVIELGSVSERLSSPSELLTLSILGRSLGVSLGRLTAEQQRAQLAVREERARGAHRAALRRLAFLAAASGVLATSLDTDTILTNLVPLVVPHLADCCVVDLLEEGDHFRRAIVYHDDPARAEAAHALQESFAPIAEPPDMVAQAVQTGQEQLYPEVSEALLRSLIGDERQLQLLQQLGIVSLLIMPIRAQGQHLGALTLFTSDPQRRLGPADVVIVKDLARRTGLALMNARLYRNLHEASAHKDELLTLLNTFLATAPLGIGFWDTSLRCVRANPALLAIRGVAPDTWNGQALYELLPGSATAINTHADQVLQSGRPILDQEVVDHVPGHPDKSRHWLVSYYPVGDPTAPLGIGAIVADITERKRLEARFLHLQKLESIGQLAGGIAHDFNNVLTAITGYATFALEELSEGTGAYADTAEVLQVAQRASTLTRQLLAFARKQVIAPQVLNLNGLVNNLSGMLRRVIGNNIELQTHLSADVHPVRVDPGQIEQVLVNLAVNARDAMPDGGTLTLETANVTRQPVERSGSNTRASQQYVMIRVSDTGVGMSAEVQKHLFEPFFTTKDAGRGTGLGLATCYGIVDQHGGWIEVESVVQQGSSFTVILPHAADELSPGAQPEASSPDLRGTETILLVEDDASVRTLAARVLRTHGYHVLETATGDEALRVAEAYGRPIQLLCTDGVLPQGSGGSLALAMCRRYPELRVLLISGYADAGVRPDQRLPEGVIRIQKPFTPSLLVQKVREVLDG